MPGRGAGETVELTPRPVRIHRLQILAYDYPELQLEIDCGSGTYVRSLGRDLAELVGTGAVMSSLVRTAIGRFRIEDAVRADQLTRENLDEFLLPAQLAVVDLMPSVEVSPAAIARLANGLAIEVPTASAQTCAALDAAGKLIAILTRRTDGQFAPSKFFPTGS